MVKTKKGKYLCNAYENYILTFAAKKIRLVHIHISIVKHLLTLVSLVLHQLHHET